MLRKPPKEPKDYGLIVLLVIVAILIALRFTPLYQPQGAPVHQRR